MLNFKHKTLINNVYIIPQITETQKQSLYFFAYLFHYFLLPHYSFKLFPLKYFFTGAARSNDGSVESRLSVKQKVREIIDSEDKSSPLSDQDIVKKLKEQGIDIARRTVTKYRKALLVPSSRERRVY